MNYLLIDDDPIINLVHRKTILKFDEGAEVKEFLSPRTALDEILQNPKDVNGHVIFLDINMPDLNGF